MYKYILPAVFGTVVLLGAWIAGYDFNERGTEAALMYGILVFAMCMGLICGLFTDLSNEEMKD